MTGTLLAIEKLEVVYKRSITAVQGITLAVEAGQIVALLGTNGAGKSTTLRAISGFLGLDDARVTEGTISFKGTRIENRPPHENTRRGIVLVPERDKVFPNLTVAENLVAPVPRGTSHAEHRRREALVYQFFPRLGELKTRIGGLLSGGERQMLALASAIVCRPELLLVDELSLGLAPVVVDRRLRLRDGERPDRARRHRRAPAQPSRHPGVLSRFQERRAQELSRREAISPQPEVVWLSSRSTASRCASADSRSSMACRSRWKRASCSR
jgi:ABC-type branched-subunit amino acid transport system ATPase component